jgi:hypothetical protein
MAASLTFLRRPLTYHHRLFLGRAGFNAANRDLIHLSASVNTVGLLLGALPLSNRRNRPERSLGGATDRSTL